MPRNQAQDLFNVDGMVAVVTGGGSGLGLYAARALDANGAKAVYIVGRRESTLNEAAKTATNGNIIPVVGDVTDKASLSAVADRARKEHGFVNFLFANAGVSGPKVRDFLSNQDPGKTPTIQELQEALWKPEMLDFTNTMHVNCTGVLYTIIAFLDLLDAGTKKRNVPTDAQILVTSSVASVSRHLASSFAYSASKAAVSHLVKMISTLCAQNRYRIRCNTIVPGLYPSEMTENIVAPLEKFSGVEGHEQYFTDASVVSAESAPAERSGSEEDFAGAILFLASRAGAYINGECLLTDGGRLAQLPATY
ncbi:hypothetical protein F4780DRAFT_570753 [Xylariomycetidae sp. FL0641]|nr:hypothetical protein F4780DRAFT_570753 [Xylariomycetidae sp. FL0641]